MKKIVLSALFVLIAFCGQAQIKIGLNFSPALAFSRLLEKDTSSVTIATKGVGLRFVAGPELSFYLGDNYAITTGAWYAIKRVGFEVTDEVTKTKTTPTFNLQYIQLPLTFKLFTNEVATDMKIYFQVGGTFDIKIAEKLKDSSIKTSDASFKPIDSSVLLGSGVEMQLGENTYFLAGLRYNRGLINAVKKSFSEDIDVKNSLVSLDLGIRF